MNRTRARIAAMWVGLPLTALACGGAFAAASAQDGPRSPQRVYEVTCGYCHGYNVGPIIRGRSLDPDLIKYFVRNGSGAMPAFRPTEITPAELDKLAEWLSMSSADPEEHGQ